MPTPFLIAAAIVYLVLPALFFWRIVDKAGLPKWWALAALVPVVNVIALWLFAYSEWPRHRP